MAKERLSNEIIAQVLTKAASSLEKTLQIHQNKMEELMKTPIKLTLTNPSLNSEEFNLSLMEQESKVKEAFIVINTFIARMRPMGYIRGEKELEQQDEIVHQLHKIEHFVKDKIERGYHKKYYKGQRS